MGMHATCSHAFCIPVIFHRRLHEVLVDGGEDRVERVESGVEEHLVRLDLEGTIRSESVYGSILERHRSYFRALWWNFWPGVFDRSTVKESDTTSTRQSNQYISLQQRCYLYLSYDLDPW